MSLAIYKYPLQLRDGIMSFTIPKGAKIVHVGDQRGTITIWAMIDKAQTQSDTRNFLVVGTGQEFDSGDWSKMQHLGTVISGMFVWHVFEWRMS